MSLTAVLIAWLFSALFVVTVLSLLARAGHHEDVLLGYTVD